MAHADLPVRQKPGTVLFDAQDITVVRGERTLLNKVSLQLRAGEVLALLGPNGAGKSTLMSVLSGETAYESGSVTFLGDPLNKWHLKQLAQHRGVLLQEHELMFPFTVYEVVEMGRAPWRRTEREHEDEAAIAEAVADAEVAHLQDRRVPSLSGGERARSSFARVLATRTHVLMLDEPTAALDLRHQEAVLRKARQRAAAGDAVLIVVHDLNLATAYADRVVMLRTGEVVAEGTPAEVLTAERVSETYETPVEVIAHPTSGVPVVLPIRTEV